MTRAIMDYGTEPTSFPRFFVGILIQYFFSPHKLAILGLITLLVAVIMVTADRDLTIFATIMRVLGTLLLLHVLVVFFFWARYKLVGVR